MITKREKTKKQLFNLNESVFLSQVSVLTELKADLIASEAEKIRQVYKFNSVYCSLSKSWSKNASKVPRKNLFTLENLKTPKDLSENETPSVKSQKNTNSSLKAKTLHKSDTEAKVEKEPSENKDADEKHRDSLFGVGNLKMLGDTTAESSEDDFVICNNEESSKTDSAQMSRLGKVKVEEIEMNCVEEMEEKKLEVCESVTKKNAGSDLKMRLTSLLQSKTLMQKQDKLVSEPLFNETLHVDVVNSDNEVFSESTDLTSPADKSRNLFDKFELKKEFLAAPDLSSPDIPKDSKRSLKRRIRRRDLHKDKRKKFVLSSSPSDQSSPSGAQVKPEAAISTDNDNDSRSVSVEHSSLPCEQSDKDKSLINPDSKTPEIDTTVKIIISPDAVDKHHRSSSKHRKSKKRSRSEKKRRSHSLHSSSSSPLKTPKLSPSPRVDPENTFGTVDGDIYVPSGKIQVNEHTIVLDSPKEEKVRVQNKLRLKKQANSPIKGVVSYEVVANDLADEKPIAARKLNEQMDLQTNESKRTKECSPDCDHKPTDHPSNGNKLREKNLPSETKYNKLLSDSDGNVINEDIKDKKKSDTPSEIIQMSPLKEKLPRKSLRSNTIKSGEPGYSSDENFVPSPERSKSPPTDKFCRQRSSRRLRNNSGESDASISKLLQSPQRKTSHNSTSVIITPFPNRPDLNGVIDNSKLVVKDSLRKHVGDRLSRIWKGRGKWGRQTGLNQLTRDALVKSVKSAENVFAKIDQKHNKTKPDLIPSPRKQKNTTTVSPKKHPNLTANGNIFGKHSPSENRVGSSMRSTRSTHVDDKETVFGDVSSQASQASFKEMGRGSPLREVEKTSIKSDHMVSSIFVDTRQNYRCHSPQSSECSEASSRNPMAESRESTPRRIMRNRSGDNSQSPITPGRLRNREGFVKSPFKSS